MSAVKVNAPIEHPGPVGYLLWLRRDLPRTYLKVMKSVPAVAAFETGLRKAQALGCCGLGDDVPLMDMSFDASAASANFSSAASAFDTSAFTSGSMLDPITVSGTYVDNSGSSSGIMNSAIPDASIMNPSVPQLPAIQTSAPATQSWLSSIGSVASSIGNGLLQSLPAVAGIVRAAAPVAIAAIQTNAALKGAYPYNTGYFTNPATGQRYLSAVSTPYGTSFSGNVSTWMIAGGAGLVLLLLMRK